MLPYKGEPLLFGQVVDRDLFKQTRLYAPPRPKHIYLEADFDLFLEGALVELATPSWALGYDQV